MTRATKSATPREPGPDVAPVERPRGGRTFRALIRERLRRACALERLPPERHGFSLETATWLFLVTGTLYRRYFRAECHGIERLPPGPVMLVANHGSHVLAWDGANVVSACLLDADPPRLVHGMAEHRLMSLPVLGRAARRIGAVDGTRAACADLLHAGGTVLVFPEGARALAKPWSERYRLVRFGHGFMQVAMAARVPIVPVATIGSEEEARPIANPRWLARRLRTPVAPLAPTLFVPLPVKYRIHFGRPLWFREPITPHDVARNVQIVRRALADLLRDGLAARRHVFF